MRYPSSKDVNTLPEFKETKKLLWALQEYETIYKVLNVGTVYRLNSAVKENRIKDLGNIVEDLDTRIILEKDGNWDVYDINLNRVFSFTNENVQTIKQAQEMFSDFKNIFRDVLRGNKKTVDLIGISGVAKMEGWKQLLKALKQIC